MKDDLITLAYAGCMTWFNVILNDRMPTTTAEPSPYQTLDLKKVLHTLIEVFKFNPKNFDGRRKIYRANREVYLAIEVVIWKTFLIFLISSLSVSAPWFLSCLLVCSMFASWMWKNDEICWRKLNGLWVEYDKVHEGFKSVLRNISFRGDYGVLSLTLLSKDWTCWPYSMHWFINCSLASCSASRIWVDRWYFASSCLYSNCKEA